MRGYLLAALVCLTWLASMLMRPATLSGQSNIIELTAKAERCIDIHAPVKRYPGRQAAYAKPNYIPCGNPEKTILSYRVETVTDGMILTDTDGEKFLCIAQAGTVDPASCKRIAP
ncbi:MAG TPA: hypothetical protein P5282_07005 [Anaerolineaceae bacterium]|nr:hypothetical protein [Anaerolineaceae bacterium]